MSDEVIREAFLYIGLDLSSITPDNYPEFRSDNLIPIAWYFLFDVKDIKTRQQVMPESIALFADEFDSKINFETDFKKFLDEPVAFETTIPKAQARLNRFKQLFKDLPYFWSYFRVIDIFEEQLITQIGKIAEHSVEDASPLMKPLHPDVTDSSVAVLEDEKDELSIDDLTAFANIDLSDFNFPTDDEPSKQVEIDDNPFAALSDFGMDAPKVENEPVARVDEDVFLLDSLGAALEMDTDKVDTILPDVTKEDDLREEQSVMYITAKFDHLAIDGFGSKIHTIFDRLDNLYHHARREEGKITRIMVDIFQDIFRESLTAWRIIGLLSEDFVRGQAARLGSIMIGNPSAFNVKSIKTFDLEYWTEKTLQIGDERLMFTLSKLPSEDIHAMIEEGSINQVSTLIEKILLLTKSKPILRYDDATLSLEPADSNIWSIRVLLPYGDSYTPGTLLCQNPNLSWKEDFLNRLNLPGVLNDWNIEYQVRFSDFAHSENYQIVFKRASGKEDTFNGFLRWIRRHHNLYRQQYGIDGTIRLLKKVILETNDHVVGQTIFTILTNLSQLGFDTAIDVLNDQKVVSRLSWLYSTL